MGHVGWTCGRRCACLSCSSRVQYTHHDGLRADSIRIPRSSKNFPHNMQTHSLTLPVVIERYAVHMLVFFFFNLGNLPCLVLIKHSRRSHWNTYSSVNRTIISVFPSSRRCYRNSGTHRLREDPPSLLPNLFLYPSSPFRWLEQSLRRVRHRWHLRCPPSSDITPNTHVTQLPF
jgi:hypothetical protein